MKQAGTINPVVLLDEIDKLSSDYRGDPASAMLEVLDPEQNRTFSDHFLDLPYDLSQVLFITTANYLGSVPRPLRDRMEVIEISGLHRRGKDRDRSQASAAEAARRARAEPQVDLDPVPRTWVRLVRDYTREAGVRQLERQIAAICRRVARDVVRGKSRRVPAHRRARLRNISGRRGSARISISAKIRSAWRSAWASPRSAAS